MKIICGLGNPGKQYELTHHNMGFLAIDEIADRFDVKVNKLKFKALLGETRIGNEKVILVKPQTFMNASGEALRQIMDFYKAQPEDLMVIYDDIDIPTGNLRMRASGSSGSHNGMKSIIYQLQYDNFPRLRVGIGTRDANIPLMNYVLSGITDAETILLKPAIVKAADSVEIWIKEDIKKAMNFANQKPKTDEDAGKSSKD